MDVSVFQQESLLEKRNVHFFDMKNSPREVFAWTSPKRPRLPGSL
jgi:hypothetical protein